MPDDRNISQCIQDAINKLQHVLTGKLKRNEKHEVIEKLEPYLEAAKADIDLALSKMKPNLPE